MKRTIRPVCEPAEIAARNDRWSGRRLTLSAAVALLGVRSGVALMPVMLCGRASAGHAYHEKAIRDGRDHQAKPVRLREL
jgi:hypothetical protein